MLHIDLSNICPPYTVRRLDNNDIQTVYDLCKGNTLYYRYCGKDITPDLIRDDLAVLPPNTTPEQKFYVGFFDDGELVAVMDLVCGYPTYETAFVGFFMMNASKQGTGVGSKIISTTLDSLCKAGYTRCRLGIDKGNPQSTHFWQKNGFVVLKEIPTDYGTILLAEKQLTLPNNLD